MHEWGGNLAAISIIANIVTPLTSFSRAVVSQIKECGEDAHVITKAFPRPTYSAATDLPHDSADSTSLDDDVCKVLRPLLDDCENKLKQLEVIFNEVMAQRVPRRSRLA